MNLEGYDNGAYFITVQNVIEKFHIEKTKLLLQLKIDFTEYNFEPGHACSKCGYLLHESACEIFDQLPDLEMSPKFMKMSLFYIAGYVSRKDGPLTDEDLLNDTGFYYRQYADFVKKLDRGSLNIPLDNTVQWVFFCFIMFNVVNAKACRKSMTNIFMLVSEMYTFNKSRKHGMILSNIFFKNYCLLESPKATQEPTLKVLKLS